MNTLALDADGGLSYGKGRLEGDPLPFLGFKVILEEGYRADLNLEEAKALAVKAVLRKKRRAEDVLVTSIDAKTKNFTEAPVEERKKLLSRIFP